MVEYCPPFDFNTALTFWVGTVAQGIVIVIGLIGNTLILLVYSSTAKNDSSNLVCKEIKTPAQRRQATPNGRVKDASS
jgi:hypothetical protein